MGLRLSLEFWIHARTHLSMAQWSDVILTMDVISYSFRASAFKVCVVACYSGPKPKLNFLVCCCCCFLLLYPAFWCVLLLYGVVLVGLGQFLAVLSRFVSLIRQPTAGIGQDGLPYSVGSIELFKPAIQLDPRQMERPTFLKKINIFFQIFFIVCLLPKNSQKFCFFIFIYKKR